MRDEKKNICRYLSTRGWQSIVWCSLAASSQTENVNLGNVMLLLSISPSPASCCKPGSTSQANIWHSEIPSDISRAGAPTIFNSSALMRCWMTNMVRTQETLWSGLDILEGNLTICLECSQLWAGTDSREEITRQVGRVFYLWKTNQPVIW